MDTYPILDYNDADNESMFIESSTRMKINNDYIRNFHQDGKPLRYPRNIHPFKIRRHILAIIVIILLLVCLVGVSFSFKFWIKYEYKEFGFCGLFVGQCLLLLIYYILSSRWLNELIEFGFFYFPIRMSNLRTIILFLWSIGIFLMSPLLVVVKLLCKESKYDQNVYCLWHFNDVHIMQLYLGLVEIIVVICLFIYVIKVCIFKRKRLWPDVWNEQLEGEGKLIDYCPLIQQAELIQLEPNHQTFHQTLSQRILHTQAYLIRYLKHHNTVLSMRLLKLTNENKQLYNALGNAGDSSANQNEVDKQQPNNDSTSSSYPNNVDSNVAVLDSSISSYLRRSSVGQQIESYNDERSSY